MLSVNVPTWRPDIYGQIDLVEEIIRIKGFDKIQSVEPEKRRLKPTLDFFQRHFHLAQRSVASKGYLETITWSFTDEKINESFKENLQKIKIINPISSELNVLRNSLKNGVESVALHLPVEDASFNENDSPSLDVKAVKVEEVDAELEELKRSIENL